MKEENCEDIVETIETNPVVTLVVVDEFGSVKMMEVVGGREVVGILSLAASSQDYPITKDDCLLDCVGQDIYICNSYNYLHAISGAFLYGSRDRSKDIVRICDREGLKFSFVVSY